MTTLEGSWSRLAAALLLAGASAAQAAVTWDEAQLGDLSNDGLTPTPLTLAAGSNLVLGATGDAGSGVDRDYFSIQVPAGLQLSSLLLLASTTVSGGASFIALQAGPQLTVSPSGVGIENLIGFTHYGTDLIGSNLLESIAVSRGGTLGAGTYSLWVQETGGPVSYGLDFSVTAVPEPQAALLLLAGLLVVGAAQRRR